MKTLTLGGAWRGVKNGCRFGQLRTWHFGAARRVMTFGLVMLSAWWWLAAGEARAVAPPLKPMQVSLNGIWREGGTVPVYGGEVLRRRVYARQVNVPSAWTDKIIRVEFEAVNYACDVYVNNRLMTTHSGAWNPFAVDVTKEVRAGESFELRIEVRGMTLPPTVESDNQERYPLGAQILNDDFGGIADDVWLRAYGRIAITDAYIQTSYRQRELAVDYTVNNFTNVPRRVVIEADIVNQHGTRAEKTLRSDVVQLAPGETRTVRVVAEWRDAALWFPDAPHLYLLHSRVREAAKVSSESSNANPVKPRKINSRAGHRANPGDDFPAALDRETRRFGFREMWTQGNQFRLNGVRLNVRGDYLGYGGYIPKSLQTREALPGVYDDLKSLNMNALRWHMHPAPAFAYDLADEKGLIIVCESAIYGRPGFMPPDVKKIYVENARAWIAAWARRWRNQASVLMWSVVNEMGAKYVENGHQSLTLAELKSLGAELRKYDRTRPVLYHGNAEVTDEDAINYHYPPPAGWQVVTASIYSWASLVDKNRPTGVGEFFQTSKTARHPKLTKAQREVMAENNIWWLGIWTRGMRYLDFADFRPKIYFWAHKEMDSPRTANLRNAYHPIALFDKDYDDLGIVPYVDGEFPVVVAGATQTRSLVLYNDEFQDENITVEVAVKAGGNILSTARQDYRLTLGNHRDIACTFNAPAQDFEVVLRTYKRGRLRFEEAKRFRTKPPGASDNLSTSITITLDD